MALNKSWMLAYLKSGKYYDRRIYKVLTLESNYLLPVKSTKIKKQKGASHIETVIIRRAC